MRALTEPELKTEQRKIYRGVGAAILFCTAVLVGAHLFLPMLLQFPGSDLHSQLKFWASASVFVIAWVMCGIGMVSHGRRHSTEDIQGSAYGAPSPRIAVRVAFLQNTLEQAVVAVLVYLSLVLLVGAPAMPFVAGSVVLFIVGRVSFLAGYPHGAGARSFGMAVTFLPSIAGSIFAFGAVLRRVWF